MKAAIMQPYFFPYIGYFQLMNAVDKFVVYDNIEYTKKGWINRNRILENGKDILITLPIKKGSDYLHVKDRYLGEGWNTDREKLLNKIKESYRKAPYFIDTFAVVETALRTEEVNLFNFLLRSLKLVKDYLNINTEIIVSSAIDIDHSQKAEKKVIHLCKAIGADQYINPPGGKELYDITNFKVHNIDLSFIKPVISSYPQSNLAEFVPMLSIIDVMMYNSVIDIKKMLSIYFL